MRKLWDEYAKLALNGRYAWRGNRNTLLNRVNSDKEVIRGKLNTFLDQFQSAYQQLVPLEAARTLDRIYGDFSDILLALLEAVEKSQLTDKALTVAELILRVLNFLCVHLVSNIQ